MVSKCGKSCRLLLELVGTLHDHPDGELCTPGSWRRRKLSRRRSLTKGTTPELPGPTSNSLDSAHLSEVDVAEVIIIIKH
jgi:hypothetical protein